MDELDKELLSAPYRKMQNLEEHSELSYLLRVYQQCFQNTYKAKYLSPSQSADIGTIRDIKKTAGDTAGELIEHFFKMKDKWFVDMRHSLPVLKNNLNAVNSDFQKKKGVSHAHHDLRIILNVSCDKCEKYYRITTTPRDWVETNARICNECKNPNQTL